MLQHEFVNNLYSFCFDNYILHLQVIIIIKISIYIYLHACKY